MPATFEGLFSGGNEAEHVEPELLCRYLADDEMSVVHGIE